MSFSASLLMAGALAYQSPYVMFEAAARSPVRDVHPATIMRVDGAHAGPHRAGPLTPGVHEIEVSLPGPMAVGKPTRQTLVIDAQPCTRYFVAAARSSRTSRDWQAYVERSEAIGECNPNGRAEL